MNKKERTRFLVGEVPAFPRESDPVGVERMNFRVGMTYRQWLIGQFLSGSAATFYEKEAPTPYDYNLMAYEAVAIADRVIDVLTEEILEKEGGANAEND